MKYGIEFHELVFPKYAKLVFKINKAGHLVLAASPSLTPGKYPPGVRPGVIPKGTKIFDYDNSIIVSLEFSDCLKLLDYIESKSPLVTVDVYRNSNLYNKKITFNYFPLETDPSIAKFASIFFNCTDSDGKEIHFNLPLSFDNLNEMGKIIESYVNNYAMIKLFTAVEAQNE